MPSFPAWASVRPRLLGANPCPDFVPLLPKRRGPMPRPPRERKLKPLDRCFLVRDKVDYNRTCGQNPVWIDRPSLPNSFCFQLREENSVEEHI